jgi:hypothetical protein
MDEAVGVLEGAKVVLWVACPKENGVASSKLDTPREKSKVENE